MRLLSKIMKQPEEEQVRSYDFFAGFMWDKEESREEPPSEEAEIPESPREEEDLLKDARQQAERILKEAREQAELLRQNAFEEGRTEGEQEGFRTAYEEHRETLNRELRSFQQNFADAIQEVSREKDKILEKYIDDLKDISLAVAEKVIKTSLRSSEDVIKRMILTATDKLKKKQWAKIFITKCSTGVGMEVDTELLEALSHLSDNVKIITMNNGEEGSCIIELPDEVIDASVGTQLENIRDIINNVRI